MTSSELNSSMKSDQGKRWRCSMPVASLVYRKSELDYVGGELGASSDTKNGYRFLPT